MPANHTNRREYFKIYSTAKIIIDHREFGFAFFRVIRGQNFLIELFQPSSSYFPKCLLNFSMKVLGLIPARGGSKGVPRKNVRLLGGKPLLALTAETALQSRKLTRVVLSTEDREIAAIGRGLGLEVPFLRPAELALDTTPTLPVIQHVLHGLDEEFEAVCLLQPTNPLRRLADIENCIDLLENTNADAVVSVLPVPDKFNPHWVFRRESSGQMFLVTGETQPITRRQDLPTVFYRDGSIYVTKTKVLLEQNSLYGNDVRGYPMNPAHSINIDTEEDWQELERRYNG